MRTKIAVVLILGAFLLGIVIALSITRTLVRGSAPQVAGTATVIQQIQSLSELVTVKYVMQKIVIFTNSSTTTLGQLPNVIKLPGFEEDRVMLMAHGVVKAGVDLAKLKPEDVQAVDRTITLRLPRPIVTDAYLDEAQTQVLDRKTGLFRTFDKTLEAQARQYARQEVTRTARQNGIEREAEQRAREQLGNLLRTLGYTNVSVTTR
ncbi:MAG TPA: DUF4230 domain-containing protein [Candidatus Acidoferrum sp.]|nr:DUF4230 domain-containing protein [Candidatus Acidoferrum sp.]